MDYGPRTMRNFNTLTLSTIVAEICGPNPYRSALVFSPIGGQAASAPALIVATIAPASTQSWQVPSGVTSVLDMFVWGAAGNPGAAGAVLGGGGGGGGGFATTGSLTVVPGTIYTTLSHLASGGGRANITSPAGVLLAEVGTASDGVLDVGGAGGVPAAGVIQQAGGAGSTTTALAGLGGGGGGAAGYNAPGGAGAARIGGSGGGSATYSTYGAGGAGGNGGLAAAVGLAGTSPGGAAGGSGANGAAPGASSNSLIAIIYAPSPQVQGISLDQDPSLILMQGAFNYLAGATYPTMVSRRDIGDCIIEPWYAIVGIAGQVLRVTEYSYVPEAPGRDVQGAGQAFTHPPYSG